MGGLVIRAILQTLACAAIGAATNAAVRRFYKGPAKRLFTFKRLDGSEIHATNLDELVDEMVEARLNAEPFTVVVQRGDQRVLIMEYPHGGGPKEVH